MCGAVFKNCDCLVVLVLLQHICTGVKPRVFDQPFTNSYHDSYLSLRCLTSSYIPFLITVNHDVLFCGRYFTAMWQVVSPWVDPKTRNNVSIHGSSDYQPILCDYVGAENVPMAFGGTDTTPLGQSPEELALKAFIEARLHKANSESPSTSTSSKTASDAAPFSSDAVDLAQPVNSSSSSPSPPLLPAPSSFPDAPRLEVLANQGVAALLENASPQSPGWTLLKYDSKLRLTVQTRSQPSVSSISTADRSNANATTAATAAGSAPKQFRAIIELPYSAVVAYAAVLDNQARLAWDKSIADLKTLTVRALPLPLQANKESFSSDGRTAASSSNGSQIVPFYGLMHCTTKQIGPIQGRDFVDAVYAGPLNGLPNRGLAAVGGPDRDNNSDRSNSTISSSTSSNSSSNLAAPLHSREQRWPEDASAVLVNGGAGIGPKGHSSFPITSGLVRGENQPGCGFVFEPMPFPPATATKGAARSSNNSGSNGGGNNGATVISANDERKLENEDSNEGSHREEWVRVKYCVQSDLKGWLPPSLVNATMANVFRDFFRDLSDHIARQQQRGVQK